jgi:hypothetical protein
VELGGVALAALTLTQHEQDAHAMQRYQFDAPSGETEVEGEDA